MASEYEQQRVAIEERKAQRRSQRGKREVCHYILLFNIVLTFTQMNQYVHVRCVYVL
jgi:hypothetical protein